MKTLIRAALVLVVLLAAAVTPVLAGGPVQVFEKYNIWIPLEDTLWFDCVNNGDGEYIQISGWTHAILYVRRDAQNGLHKTIHFNTRGTGVGLSTGDKYVGHDIFNQSLRGEVYEEEYTLAWTAAVTGKGQQANIKVRERVHITINANGEVTSAFARLSEDCK
jgi:hypothetical protein